MADLLKYERLLFTVEALDHISRLWGDAEYTAEVKEAKATPARRDDPQGCRYCRARDDAARWSPTARRVETPVETTDAATDDTTEAKA